MTRAGVLSQVDLWQEFKEEAERNGTSSSTSGRRRRTSIEVAAEGAQQAAAAAALQGLVPAGSDEPGDDGPIIRADGSVCI